MNDGFKIKNGAKSAVNGAVKNFPMGSPPEYQVWNCLDVFIGPMATLILTSPHQKKIQNKAALRGCDVMAGTKKYLVKRIHNRT